MGGDIASQIKERITQEGLTVYSLEKRAGLKPNAVHNILSGRSKKPSINIIQAIAKTLNCTVSDLIGEGLTTIAFQEENINTSNISSEYIKNRELYIKCLFYFSSLLNKKKLWLPKTQLLDCIDEIYFYSLKKGLNKKIDPHFVQWLIDKSKK